MPSISQGPLADWIARGPHGITSARTTWFTRTGGDTGAALIAVVTAPELASFASTVTVFADDAAPIFTRTIARGEITGPATRDRKRRPGAYPVVIDGATVLRWDGATLVDPAVGP